MLSACAHCISFSSKMFYILYFMLLFCVYVCPVCAPCKDWCVLVSVFLNIALPCFWIALEVADVNSGGGGGGGWLAYDTVATC